MIALRAIQRGDLSFVIAVRNECRAMLHDDTEFTLPQAEEWFDATHPRFYIASLDGAPIGYFRTSQWDETNRRAYIGFDLHRDYRGKGLAQDAYAVFLRHMFDEIGMNKVTVEVLEHNHRAQRLYERIGFVFEGRKRQEVWRDGRYLDSMILSILKSEYLSRRDGAPPPRKSAP